MSIDRAKVLQTAQKFLAKGQLDKAIAEYDRLVKDDPKDVRTLLKIGDIYARKGASQEACATYQQVAMRYAEQGFFLKAVAVYKQILKLEPNQMGALEQLADMYRLLNLASDAVITYEQLYAAYTRVGDMQRALESLAKMVEVEPTNAAAWVRYAEALSEANSIDEAVEAYANGARMLKEQGRLEDCLKVAERLFYYRSNDLGMACEIAEIYLDVNDARSALLKLQACFKANPRDIWTLELLARAFQQLGQQNKTVSVYKELARLHRQEGRLAEQAEVLQRILELNPADKEAEGELAKIPEEARSRPPSEQPPEEESMAPESAAQQPEPEPAPEPEPLPAPEEEELFADRVEKSEPKRLADRGPVPKKKALLSPVPLKKSELPATAQTSARPYLDKIAYRQPPELKAPPAAAASRDAAGSASRAAAKAPGTIASLSPAAERPIDRLMSECEVFLRYNITDRAIAALKKVLEIDPGHQEARRRLELLMSKQPAVADDEVFFVEESEPTEPAQASGRLAEEAPTQGAVEPDEAEVTEELAEQLEEIEFYLAQQLLDEARGVLEDALAGHPGHPALLRAKRRIEGPKADRAAIQAEAPRAAKPTAAAKVEAPPRAARREASREPISAESRYERGIAYMEMELHDSAIKEFTACLENRDLECTAHTMIGLCYVAKGEVKEAIKHFNRGLAVPNHGDKEEVPLRYELGNAYELLKMPAEALKNFRKAADIDPDFRDLAQRIARLSSVEKSKDELDDFEEMFDGIIIKD